MPEISNEDLLKQIEDLSKTVSEQQKTLLEHAVLHEDQEKVNKSVGKSLKEIAKAPAAQPAAAVKPEAKKKPEPLVTPTKVLKISNGKEEGEYLFTGPKAKDKDGQVVLTAVIVESPEDYKTELENWVKTGSGILKKKV